MKACLFSLADGDDIIRQIENFCFDITHCTSDDDISDKMGIDATVPLGADPFRFERIRIPGENSVRLEDYIAD